MEYSKLTWHHADAELPVEIYSEYDADGWEIRKVEVFSDGSTGFAGPRSCKGTTQLSLIQKPADADVTADSQFRIEFVTAAEFDRAWRAAVNCSPSVAVPAA